MITIESFTDIEDLKFQIASNPDVINAYAQFANLLGYGWCGGTATNEVGKDFNVIKDTDVEGQSSYSAIANYRASDPFGNTGTHYWADKRLKMNFSRFKILIDPAKMNFEPPLITNYQPKAIETYVAANKTNTDANVSLAFSSDVTDTKSHSVSTNVTAGVELSLEAEADVPEVAKFKTGVKYSFSIAKGWTDGEDHSTGKSVTPTFSNTLPKGTQAVLSVIAATTKSESKYAMGATVQFDVTFNNFLRATFNAFRVGTILATDRPFYPYKLGLKSASNDMSSAEFAQNIYNHRNIPNSSEWDFNAIEKQYPGALNNIMAMIQTPVEVVLKGKFTDIMGDNIHIEMDMPTPIPGFNSNTADSPGSPVTLHKEDKSNSNSSNSVYSNVKLI